MAVSAGDISIVLSGGSSNVDPSESLGGDPSNVEVSASPQNNLFEDVETSVGTLGHTDFRCVYVFNDNVTDTLYNTHIYLNSEVPGGSSIQIGVVYENDVQLITVLGTPTGGSFTLQYGLCAMIVVWDVNPIVWAGNLETVLNTCPDLVGCTVIAYPATGGIVFRITFEGAAANRYFEPLIVTSNDLVGVTTITITKLKNGAPINSIAMLLTSEIAVPPNVVFSDGFIISTISIGDLKPLDGFPVWIQRDTPMDAETVRNDGFTLRIIGDPTL